MKIYLTHDQLADNLAQHLLRDDRIVWTDIPAGRQGSCRPDVYTIQPETHLNSELLLKLLIEGKDRQVKKETAKELRMMKGMVNRNFKDIIGHFGLEDAEDKND